MTGIGTIAAGIGRERTAKIGTGAVVLMVGMTTGHGIGPVTEVTVAGRQEDRIVPQVSSVLAAGRRVAALVEQFAGGSVAIGTGITAEVTCAPFVGVGIVTAVGRAGAVEIASTCIVVISVADRGIVEVNGTVVVIRIARTGVTVTIGAATDITRSNVIGMDRCIFIGAGMVYTVSNVTAGTVSVSRGFSRMAIKAFGRVGAQGNGVNGRLPRAVMTGRARPCSVGGNIVLSAFNFSPGGHHVTLTTGNTIRKIIGIQANGMGMARVRRIKTTDVTAGTVSARSKGLADRKGETSAGGGVMTADAVVMGLRTDQGVVVTACTGGPADGHQSRMVR